MTVAHLMRPRAGKPIAEDIRRAEQLLTNGDAQAAALVACVALERRLRTMRSPYTKSGLRAVAVALRAQAIISKKQYVQLRWIVAQRNALMHGARFSDAGATSVVRQIVAFLTDVEGARPHA
jgi:hypothetical protein